ncbi:valine--tRNA ligase [Treponema phagedenis]|uniref:Valine--tRNA ligase n=1 Tax=Treponema phagedenis TaxID=162 RepID=A0A0B7H1N8_TREPH|nr:valine--tRNA ligase [Treponema phagedenis]NVP25267.1 valine--tRNA ligase [Treponema phagedenis]QEJ94002.1 valine--tRNA ligase [Treponema phagedenis]QEJ97056.1 valine--tRNA ligase [Treponema phagedenis]QEK01991.1 valine--tRNA ligase [Treponema phagedenis]QEK02966.1 valine--tRNA ligase [Treponema phagedenis]
MAERLQKIELEKAYNPKDFEDRIYEQWESQGCFKPVKRSDTKENYVVVIPPPNVTGVLHMGHGLNNTLQDIVVRYHRMKGDETLWVPGTDHAGIATQNVVERQLKKEGKSRHDLTREEFLQRTWQVKDAHHAIIVNQLKKIGASADWSRERFTLDEGLSAAVREVFVTLYERGLLYRGNYLVNWCTRCGTALADDEVEYTDKKGAMYHIYYKLADGQVLADGSDRIEIATTRPETLLGDTAVAVHPEDERYAHLVGKLVELPLTGRKIPIIADSYVDKEFGTGMVKITPAHDPNDWEVGKRHNLEVINILNPDGTLNDAVPQKYRGLTCEKARSLVLEDLRELDLFKNEEKITHAVGECYRCHTTIEPYLSEQWFVKMKPLAEKALSAWQKGEITFYPKKWENTYAHWMENIRDWCISRQLWWGHRIPAWYCDDCKQMTVSREDLSACTHCGSKNIHQDPDVLDTWFSSWLWPFSTLGWPSKTEDLKAFYPTTALVTAYDIIFFWVSRMIMAGLEFTGEVPFKDIYIHGLVRDRQGRKMSKSLGNGIDPLEVVKSYGADALKFTLAFMCAQGQDVLVDMESFKLGSRFANKIWNASRYILGNLEGREIRPVKKSELTELDRWIYHALNKAADNSRKALEAYRFNEAAQVLYEFFWNNFCDWYVEATKLSFKTNDENEMNRAASVLLAVLEESLRLLHPFLPFVTEEIYGRLPQNCAFGAKPRAAILMTAVYPAFTEDRIDETAARRFEAMQDIVRQVRALRTECGIDPQLKLSIALFTEDQSPAAAAKEKTDIIKMLAGLSDISFIASPAEKPASSIGTVGAGFEAFIITGEAVDLSQLRQRFQKESEKETANLARIEAKLANKNFTDHAPADVIEAEKTKLAETTRRIQKLAGYIKDLG